MFLVTIVAARWLVRRLAVPYTLSGRCGMGCVALGLLLAAEFTLVLWLRGLSISEYLASRDPVSGTVYYVMLGVFCYPAASRGLKMRLPMCACWCTATHMERYPLFRKSPNFGATCNPLFHRFLPEVVNLEATSYMQSFKWKALIMNARN